MKKIKKYIQPFVFVIVSFAYLLLSVIAINVFFDNGDWSGLGVLFISVTILLWIINPIYCAKYSKTIQGERFRILFAAYNAFVITASYISPFIKWEVSYVCGVVIFVWMLFWSILFLKPRANSCEEPELSSEEGMTSLLLQNKTKNIIAICFTCLYIINLASNSTTWQFYEIVFVINYTLPLFTAFVFLMFLFLKNKNYLLKNWLLPLAVAGELISGLFSIYSSLSNWDIQLKHIPMYPVSFIFSCLKVTLVAIMFIGSLFNFKYMKLLKYGALGHIVLSVGLLIFNIINVGGIAYHQIDMNGTLAINTSMVISSLLRILYFTGIFILTTNKRNEGLCNKSSI